MQKALWNVTPPTYENFMLIQIAIQLEKRLQPAVVLKPFKKPTVMSEFDIKHNQIFPKL